MRKGDLLNTFATGTGKSIFNNLKKDKVMIVDINKQYQTRNGKKVRIYCTDASGPYSVHGAVWSEQAKEWDICTWTKEGKYNDETEDNSDWFYDLVEVKPRIHRERWVNVYRDKTLGFYYSKESADKTAESDRMACVKIVIDCEEGEGL